MNEIYLPEIRKKITELFGLHFRPSQFKELENHVILAATDLGIDSSLSKIKDWLSKSEFTDLEINSLSAHLTVGETYFYRGKGGLELLKQIIIPKIVELRKGQNEQIRIWCAGCSSGEEPYTIALIFKEHFPELLDWNITILATDINPNAIQKAKKGEYTEWSFRDTDINLKNKYFMSSGKNWIISPEIKKMVTFTCLNLASNSYPSNLTNTEEMDVVFCRNVMMYFTPEMILDVSRKFFHSITKNGWFITSQVELSDEYFSNFERVPFEQGIYYRKSDETREIAEIPPANSRERPPDYNRKLGNVKVALNKQNRKTSNKNLSYNTLPGKIALNNSDPENLFLTGKYLECIEYCLTMIESARLNNEIFTLLVKSYSNAGLVKGAEEVIESIILKNHATPEMYYIYANFLKERNKVEQAEAILKKVIYLNHNHILAHLMLGELFEKSQKQHLAIKYYKNILGLLENLHESEIIPESDGLSVGGINALVLSRINKL